ncbi:MAG: 1,4-alpha-glucan branching protein GlgB [Polyangiales bacterium]
MSNHPAHDPHFVQVLGELDRYLLAEGTHLRTYEKLGAHPKVVGGVEGTAFAVWAPNAKRVSVVGDWNGWDGRAHPMRCHGAPGIWELFVPGVGKGAVYKYELEGPDGNLLPLKADPYAFRAEHPPSTASIVEGLSSYTWGDGEWMEARKSRQRHTSPISIYEVHLGSFRRGEGGRYLTYRELAEQLVGYVKWMGFTHVELLPISEHPFAPSWGYQPLGLFAPTSRFGTPDDFRFLVDRFHQEGIGVILDWVPAHFPADEHGLARFDGTCLYEHEDPRQGRHPDWGTLVFNYDRTEVQNFLVANALYWLDQFHIDGLRVDAVASMLYLDYSRQHGEWIPNRYGGHENIGAIAFLRRMNEHVHGEYPDTLTIAEESTAWPMVSRPTYVGGLGFDFKWNMGWMHDTLHYLSRDPVHRSHHHDEITFGMVYHRSEAYVLPLSHDEVVHGKRSLLWRMPGWRGDQFANLRMLFAYQWAYGGKKLLFMGCEFGQDHEWNHEKGIDEWLAEFRPHGGVRQLVRDLNALYVAQPSLHVSDCDHDGFGWIDCHDREHNVIALQRWGNAGDPPVMVVFNFSGNTLHGYRIGVPWGGRWAEVINTDADVYGGGDRGNLGGVYADAVPMHGRDHSVALTIPRSRRSS